MKSIFKKLMNKIIKPNKNEINNKKMQAGEASNDKPKADPKAYLAYLNKCEELLGQHKFNYDGFKYPIKNEIAPSKFNEIMFNPPIEHLMLRDLEYHSYSRKSIYSYSGNEANLCNEEIKTTTILIDKEHKSYLAKDNHNIYQVVDSLEPIKYDLLNGTKELGGLPTAGIFLRLEPGIFPNASEGFKYYNDNNVYKEVKLDNNIKTIISYDFSKDSSLIINRSKEEIINDGNKPVKKIMELEYQEYYYRRVSLELPNSSEFINK